MSPFYALSLNLDKPETTEARPTCVLPVRWPPPRKCCGRSAPCAEGISSCSFTGPLRRQRKLLALRAEGARPARPLQPPLHAALFLSTACGGCSILSSAIPPPFLLVFANSYHVATNAVRSNIGILYVVLANARPLWVDSMTNLKQCDRIPLKHTDQILNSKPKHGEGSTQLHSKETSTRHEGKREAGTNCNVVPIEFQLGRLYFPFRNTIVQD